MSIKVLSQIWANADVSGSELLVLLAMADFCDDDGRNIYPSMPTLAHKARLSESQTRRIVQSFCSEEGGLVEVVEKGGWIAGRNRPNHYRILLDSPRLQPNPKAAGGGITMTPPSELLPPPVEEMVQRGGSTMTPPPPRVPIGGGSIAMTPPPQNRGGVVSSDATTVVAYTRPDPLSDPLSDPSEKGEGASPLPEKAEPENSAEAEQNANLSLYAIFQEQQGAPQVAPDAALAALWQQCVAEVSLAGPNLGKWLAGSRLEECEGKYRVIVADRQHAEWLRVQALRAIKFTLGSMLKQRVELEIGVAA